MGTEPSASVLAEGTAVGEYVIEGKLGEGGMGSVYAAVHPIIGKKAAIKVISPVLCRDAVAVQRFLQEARAVNRIRHPNIVDVFSFGELPDGRSYFAMEWLQGKSLGELIEGGGLPLAEALAVLDQVADALEAAHEQDIVHRDLKPDNVVVEEMRGQLMVKLLDFGIAKLANPDDEAPIAHTQTGMMMGTPGYISPEQARGKGVDHRTDIYALGAMAFELVCGRLPFEADNAMDLVMKHLTEAPPRPGEVWPAIPPPLELLLLRMLEKDAAARPTLAEVRSVLEQVHREVIASGGPPTRRAFQARLNTPARGAVAPPTPALAPAPVIMEEDDWATVTRAPRRRGLYAGLGAALIAVVAIAVFAASGGTDGEPAQPAPEAASAPAAPTAPAAAGPAGTITVDVNVASARVELDGEVVAESVRQARIEVAEPGTHALRVTADGYDAFTAEVQVSAGAAVAVQAELRPAPPPPAAEPEAEPEVEPSRPPARRARPQPRARPESKKPSAPREPRGDYTLDPFAN